MEISTVVGGPGGVNSYIVYYGSSSVIIDPADYNKISNQLKELNLKPLAVLLTHGHFDHVWALKEILQRFDVPFYIHEEDIKIVSDSKFNFAERFGFAEKGRYDFPQPVALHGGDILNFANMTFKVIHTPGHTPGGVCYHINNSLFTGDTLFRGTVGRTDCYFADESALINSLKIFAGFSDDTIVYPGHGRPSTIGFELSYNPFL